jgi:hypothetical protein
MAIAAEQKAPASEPASAVQLTTAAIAAGLTLTLPVTLAIDAYLAPVGCALKTFTGLPCPACGVTTAARLSLGGDFSFSPQYLAALIVIISIGVTAIVVAGALVRFRRLPSQRSSLRLTIAIAVALGLNWIAQISG